MMLRRWAVREQFVSGAYLFDLLLVQNYDLFRRFDAHFVSGADPEK